MTFGVTLFTLLIQGTTMSWLIRQLGVVKRSDAQVEYETRHARLIAVRTAQEHLERLHRQGLLSGRARETLKPDLDRRVAAMADAVREVLRAEPHLEAQEWDKAHREALRAQRSALVGLRRNGVISEEVYGRLSQEIDAVLVDERLFSPAGTDKTDAAILGNASEESV